MGSATAQKTIVHLTTVHPRDDVRILFKQAHTLACVGRWSVVLVVADGKGPGRYDRDGVSVAIQDVGKSPWGRAGRIILAPWRAFWQVRRLLANVVHFHDPELIPAAIALKCLGHKVVYDVHEDVPRQMLTKHWLPWFLRRPLARTVGLIEWLGANLFDAVVPATPKIAERFPPRKTVTVQNFPILSEFLADGPLPHAGRPAAFVYVGVISVLRGAREMVESLQYLKHGTEVRLQLAGNFSPIGLKDDLRTLTGWSSVTFHGYVSRSDVATLINRARGGLVVLHPTENYPDAYPVKMFEYMASSLPVIASDFPLFRKIIQEIGCGLLVDPLAAEAIASAMQWILDHPEEAEKMGQKGRFAVEKTYNWERESVKLLALYDWLIGE